MQVQGKVVRVTPIQEISDFFKKCEVHVVTNEQYPQTIPVQFVNDKCDAAQNIKEGVQITIDVNLRGKEYTNKEGKIGVFLSVDGWKFKIEETIADSEVDDLPY